MIWVITRLCTDCVDTSCVTVCPVDCIYGLTLQDARYRNQLFIDPEECIGCSVCEPACPWGAIFEADKVPDPFATDIEVNAAIFREHAKEEFTTRPAPLREDPTQEEVAANDAAWGFEGHGSR